MSVSQEDITWNYCTTVNNLRCSASGGITRARVCVCVYISVFFEGLTSCLLIRLYVSVVHVENISTAQWWNDTDRRKVKYKTDTRISTTSPIISTDTVTWDLSRLSVLKGGLLTAKAMTLLRNRSLYLYICCETLIND